jgi:Family of unknown function (DUF5681)
MTNLPQLTETSGSDGSQSSDAASAVGYGRPPMHTRFKPGQSGNPKGARKKPRSNAPDLKALLERALGKKVTLKQGEEERTVTMGAVGIEQLVAQFAKGDRHARRDLIALADKLGVDLMPSQRKAIEDALPSNYKAIVEGHVLRQYDRVVRPSPVLAPPELLDDDITGQG